MEKIFFRIDPSSFTTSAFLIGILLTKDLSNEELDSVGNWLQLVGLTMQTYASQYSTIHQNDKDSKDSKDTDDLETLQKTIRKIESELEKMCQKATK